MKHLRYFDSCLPLGPLDVYIGHRLKTIRNENRLSAANFGSSFGLSARQIYQIEAGKRHLHAHELIALCRVLNIVPIDLYSDFPAQKSTLPSWSDNCVSRSKNIKYLH